MNARRVAALLREQARIASELAREFDGGPADDDQGDADEKGKPAKPPKRAPKTRAKRLRARSVPLPPGPLPQPTDLDIMRAKNMLRRRGIST